MSPAVRVPPHTLWSAALVLWAMTALVPAPACAQTLPVGPFRAFDGRLLVSADATATIGPADDIAYFNYTDYEHNALRMVRFGVASAWQPAWWLALLADARVENTEGSLYAAYARVRPFRDRPFDVQVGRIPPAFGAFARRAYATDSPFVGYPLGYQYLTALRDDAVPATADDLLRMRARGWRASYPVGNPVPDAGMPLVSAFRWDSGIQAHWGGERVDLAGALTVGNLSHPLVVENNDSKQISGRVGLTPITGLILGASGARGGWAARELPGAADAIQSAFGIDGEYSRAHWLVRGELVHSRWALPIPLDGTRAVSATATWIEGRYRITPRIVAAIRGDHLAFSTITGTLFEGRPTPWDAPVDRVEVVGGYYFQRNLVGRVGVQTNWREGGRVRQRTYLTGQLSYWF